jgi:FG-GAP repeat
LATGDLNGDGLPDLAIGAPGNNQGTPYGEVFVVYGLAAGQTFPTFSTTLPTVTHQGD